MQPALHHYLNGRIALYLGDLTEHAVDAIVNAANSSLLGGGGVDGAIHRRGGPAILEACRALRRDRWPDGLPTGQVAITPGGKLAAPFVIHTVGPIYGQEHGEEPALLAACYHNAIELATSHALKSLAFPAISTGVYGYPPEQAAIVVSTTLSQVLADTPMIDEVRLVFFAGEQLETFVAHQRFPI
ncbi:MAG: Appr-p processing [Proteobacteria bacterium]|nr:Appr-p processing [Pseudomonadota bacterium]